MAENKKSLLAPVYKWLDEFMEYIYLALSRKIKKKLTHFRKTGSTIRETGSSIRDTKNPGTGTPFGNPDPYSEDLRMTISDG